MYLLLLKACKTVFKITLCCKNKLGKSFHQWKRFYNTFVNGLNYVFTFKDATLTQSSLKQLNNVNLWFFFKWLHPLFTFFIKQRKNLLHLVVLSWKRKGLCACAGSAGLITKHVAHYLDYKTYPNLPNCLQPVILTIVCTNFCCLSLC